MHFRRTKRSASVKADKENAPTTAQQQQQQQQQHYIAIAESNATIISSETNLHAPSLSSSSSSSPSFSSASSSSSSSSSSLSSTMSVSCNKILLRPVPPHPAIAAQPLTSASANQSSSIPPRLFRCHSDSSQRVICSDVNLNTSCTMKSCCSSTITTTSAYHVHRHVFSAEEKMSNLQDLNSTLVREVSSLRASQSNMKALQSQLQATSYTAESLRREKEELEEDVENIRSEMNERIEAERKAAAMAEDRLQSVSSMVDNLKNTNDRLAAEAARLREDAEVSMSEREKLMDEMDKILGEKDLLEDLVESLRFGEEALTRALAEARAEKNDLEADKQKLVAENGELRDSNEKLSENVRDLRSEKDVSEEEMLKLRLEHSTLEKQKESLVFENRALQHTNEKLSQNVSDINSEKNFLLEEVAKMRLELSAMAEEKEEMKLNLDVSATLYEREVALEKGKIVELQKEYDTAMEVLRKEKEAHKKSMDEASQLRFFNKKINDEKERLKKDVHSLQNEKLRLLSQGKMQQEELKDMQKELLHSKKVCEEIEIQKKAAMKQATVVAEKLKTVSDSNAMITSENIELQRELSGSTKVCSSLKEELLNVQNELLFCKETSSSFESLSVKAVAQIGDLEAKLEESYSANGALNAMMEKLEAQLSVAEKDFHHAREEIKDLKEELLLCHKSYAESEERNMKSGQLVIELEAELSSRNKEFHDAQEVMETLKEEILLAEKVAAESDMEKNKAFDQVTSLHEELSASKNAMNESIRKLEEASSQVSAMEEKLAAAERREKSLNSKITSMKHDLDRLQEQKNHEHQNFSKRLEENSKQMSILNSKLVSAETREDTLKAQIQIMKGDLLVAEEAAMEAEKKKKIAEKESKAMVEKQTREASQKISMLETKLTDFAGKHKEMEMLVSVKENACKAAMKAEREAKAAIVAERARLQRIMDQEQLELLKSTGLEMKMNAIKINRYIASLEDDFSAAKMETKLPLSDVSNKSSKNGRSKKNKNRCSL